MSSSKEPRKRAQAQYGASLPTSESRPQALFTTAPQQWGRAPYELSRLPKPEGSLWHAFRRLWATERKHLSVKDVAAAGGWNDVTTLIDSYHQPDEQALRAVMEYQSPKPRPSKSAKVKA
jgi:hypothetical protein